MKSRSPLELPWFKLQRCAIWLFQINFIKGFPWGHNLGEAFFFGYFSIMGYCWNSSFPLRTLGIFKDLPNMGFDKKIM